jgi:valyl-tRNA synthetase
VARFAEKFLEGYCPPKELETLLPTDRWILSRLQRVVDISTEAFQNYDYATALAETETFFWHDLADNYLEMAKYRLYDEKGHDKQEAQYSLYHVLVNILKLLAPILPHITDQIFLSLFSNGKEKASIHWDSWPDQDMFVCEEEWETFGDVLIRVISAVRRYKSEHHLPLSTELKTLWIAVDDHGLIENLERSETDIRSATRAQSIKISEKTLIDGEVLLDDERMQVVINL